MRIVFLFVLLACCGLTHAAEMRGVRLSEEDGRTRAVIELSESADYKVFALDNPVRIVLDLEQVRARRAVTLDAKGLVSGVRSGHPDGKQLRIVFDLTQAAKIKSFFMRPSARAGHRLVLDLTPVGEAVAAAPATPVKRASEETSKARNVVIAIDAGHGGKDPGSIGPKGTYEKTVALKVALALAQRINDEPGMQAVLTRDGDSFIPLEERFEIARKARADLFVSIHADAFQLSTVSGSSVFVLSQRGASSEAVRFLADRENRSDLVGGVSLDDKDDMLARVLLDLSQSATQEASAAAAASVLQSLKRFGKTHKRHVEHANFVVLRSPDVASMLIETGFISNPTEEANLNSAKHRGRLADAILDGIRQYFQTSPPPGTWLAQHSPKRSTRAQAPAVVVAEQSSKAGSDSSSREHRVASGETLSDIAVKHRVSLSKLRQANNIRGNMLRAGVVLKIPRS
jgi:N-acetylmuramoyl-L-alanine amidase